MAFYDARHSTIRCEGCEWLLPPQLELSSPWMRCGKCNPYRKTLNRMLFRAKDRREVEPGHCEPNSHTNYRYLSTLEKCMRLQRLHQQNRVNQQRMERLQVCSMIVASAFNAGWNSTLSECAYCIQQYHPPLLDQLGLMLLNHGIGGPHTIFQIFRRGGLLGRCCPYVYVCYGLLL